MATENRNSIIESLSNSCPFLGLIDDSKTAANFPSELNYCYRKKRMAVPSFDHQKYICLSNIYKSCPIYVKTGIYRLPRALRWQKAAAENCRKFLWVALPFIAVGLLVLAFFIGNEYYGWMLTQPPNLSMTFTLSPTSSLIPTSTTIVDTAVPPQATNTVFVIPSGTQTETPIYATTSTPTRYSQYTLTKMPTNTPTLEPINTSIPTQSPSPSITPETPTHTPTNTPETPTHTPTNTPEIPTDTPTNTPETPTDIPG